MEYVPNTLENAREELGDSITQLSHFLHEFRPPTSKLDRLDITTCDKLIKLTFQFYTQFSQAVK